MHKILFCWYKYIVLYNLFGIIVPILCLCKVNKKEAIFNAALNLLVTKGEQDASMKLIANHANCGIGTMYNYFESKEVLINELYMKLKDELLNYVFENFDTTKNVKEKFNIAWLRVINYGIENHSKYRYIAIYGTNCKIDDTIKEASNKLYTHLFPIYQQGIDTGLIKNLDISVMILFNNGAISNSIIHNGNLNMKQKQDIINMTWDSIKS